MENSLSLVVVTTDKVNAISFIYDNFAFLDRV